MGITLTITYKTRKSLLIDTENFAIADAMQFSRLFDDEFPYFSNKSLMSDPLLLLTIWSQTNFLIFFIGTLPQFMCLAQGKFNIVCAFKCYFYWLRRATIVLVRSDSAS